MELTLPKQKTWSNIIFGQIGKTKLKLKKKAIKTNGYIPFYLKKIIKFDPLLKEVFWLVKLEQTVLNKKVKRSFEGIAKSVDDTNHIIHAAFNLRNNPSKNKEKNFVLKLKRHLDELEKNI